MYIRRTIDNIAFQETDGRGTEYAHEDMDCTVRALAVASGMPYSASHTTLKRAGRQDGHRFSMHRFVVAVGGRVCNYRVTMLDTGLSQVWPKPTVNQMLKAYPKGRYIFRTQHHVFAVIDGVMHDRYPEGKRRKVYRVWRFDAQ